MLYSIYHKVFNVKTTIIRSAVMIVLKSVNPALVVYRFDCMALFHMISFPFHCHDYISFSGRFSMMKMMLVISAVFVLLAICDNLYVEAGLLGFGKKQYDKIGNMNKHAMKFQRCCKRINCEYPDLCYPSINPRKFCDCFKV